MYYRKRVSPSIKKGRRPGGVKKPGTVKTKTVALGYAPTEDNAPRVLATGQGKLAERIISIAKENDIPIHEDPILAAALSGVDLNATIPPELYVVVAEVLAYIYRVGGKKISGG